jgi:predicted small metal-binding protein
MAKVLRCRDAGVDCNWEARAETTEELRKLAIEHAQKEHGMKEIPEYLWKKAQAAVRDE